MVLLWSKLSQMNILIILIFIAQLLLICPTVPPLPHVISNKIKHIEMKDAFGLFFKS